MTNPKQTIRWLGSRSAITQVNQIKAAGIAVAPFSSNPQAQSPNTQGAPKLVTNVATTKKILTATTCRVTVSFSHNSGDPYFTAAKVFLTVGSGIPSLVAEGNSSPLTFATARTGVPASVVVVSHGNWGSTAIASSPGKSVSLA